MRYLSLCSGIEAATVAWHGQGWSPVAFSEVDTFPSAVLAHHYPDTPNWGDMTKFKEWPDADVDVLVGGTPCQSFSVAGLRKGMDDPRGNLALVYLAIADRYKPRWLVWENVPGVLSSSGGRDFGAFLGALAKLGYGFAYRVLDAQYHGVAQRRRRVFVVGYLGDWRRAAAVLFEPESLRGDSPPSRQAREVAPTAPSRRTGGGGLGTDFDRDGGVICMAHGQANAEVSSERSPALTCNHEAPIIAPPLMAQGNSTGGDRPPGTTVDTCESLIPVVSHTLRGEGFDASEDGSGRGTPLVPVAFPAELSATQCASTKDLSPALSVKHTMAVTTLAIRGRGDGHQLETRSDGIANAILTPNGGRGGIGVGAIHHGIQVRRLTPVECERLQGFPDGYTMIQQRGKPAADGPRYKALGNSMAVPVMRWIGKRIQMAEEI